MKFIHGNCNCIHDDSFYHKEVMDTSFGNRYRIILFKSKCFIELDDIQQGEFDESALLFVVSGTSFKYGAVKGTKLVHDWIEFSTDSNEENLYGLNHDFVLHNMDDRFVRLLSKRMKNIVRESYGNESNRQRVISLNLELLLIDIARYVELNANVLKKEDKTHPLYKKLCLMKNEILSGAFDEKIVSKTCEKYGISESHFRKLYKELFYNPIGRDILSKKVLMAQKYLTDGNKYSITQIVYILGYKNHETFFRQFKKMTGMTPMQYKKKFIGYNENNMNSNDL